MRKLAMLLLWSMWLGCRAEPVEETGLNTRPDDRHPQEMYTYPGCANEDYNCPRLKTVYCALETLRAEHARCEQDSDCVAATLDGRCTGQGQCPPAMVNATGRADFETKAAAEVERYCGTSPMCASIGSCAYPSFVPRCRQGSCFAEPVSP